MAHLNVERLIRLFMAPEQRYLSLSVGNSGQSRRNCLVPARHPLRTTRNTGFQPACLYTNRTLTRQSLYRKRGWCELLSAKRSFNLLASIVVLVFVQHSSSWSEVHLSSRKPEVTSSILPSLLLGDLRYRKLARRCR